MRNLGKVFTIKFSSVYPLYIQKVEKSGVGIYTISNFPRNSSTSILEF